MNLDRWRRAWRNGIRTISKKIGFNRYSLLQRVKRKGATIPHIFGLLMLYIAIAMLIPLLTSIFYEEDIRIWIYPIVLSTILGGMLVLRYRSPDLTRPTEALFAVSTGWFVIVLLGAIPFILSGMSPVDAVFEMMSGFTTTGSTIMTDIESWSRSLLFWRSFSQWLGGAGIIMIFVTILPMLGVGGRSLFKNEFPGLNVQNFSLRIREESRKFHYIYIGFSGLQLGLLLLTGIDVYDSFLVMFSTMSSGGMSPHSTSIAFYNNPLVEWNVILFMFLTSANFYLHYHALANRRLRSYWESSEFRSYIFIIAVATLIIAAMLWGGDINDLERTVRTSLFQVVSISSSTGFATADFAVWESGAILILLIVMAIGGSTGSSAGGIKVARMILARKFVYASLYKTVHPRALFHTRFDGRPLGEDALTSLMAVIICYGMTAMFATAALTIMGVDPVTSFSGALATLSNCGPGIGAFGPTESYAFLPDLGKIVLTFTMWAGRLEFLTVLVIFLPVCWKELLRYHE